MASTERWSHLAALCKRALHSAFCRASPGIADEKNEVCLHVKAGSDDLEVFLILELCNNKKGPIQCSKMFFWSKVVNTNKI